MPDQVREAIFSILGARYETGGMLPPLRVADVFAGGGSMGLEALSRGAVSCSFFERGREALASLTKNVDELCQNGEATIIRRDAWRAACDAGPLDLMFLDPPFPDSDETSDRGQVRKFLTKLAEVEGIRPLMVLRHRASAEYSDEMFAPWDVEDRRRFGVSTVVLLS